MNPVEIKVIESRRQALLGQLTAAETALRNGLHSQGIGGTARAHLERAMAHLCEAYIAINERKSVRTVQQLVEDLNRVQQVLDDVQRRKSQRI
jgi:tetrahydromethanopterin S-methyltransferase subunit F